jgi:hypothetical protein
VGRTAAFGHGDDPLDGRRSLLRLTGLFAPLLVLYVGLYLGGGFSYIAALRTATHLENPHGFRLLAEPLSYLSTRLEDVCEIAVFAGPVLLSLILGNAKDFVREHPLGGRLLVTGLATLAALFLTGAYRTGETARACLFIFPYLLSACGRNYRTRFPPVPLANGGGLRSGAADAAFWAYFW